MRGVIGGVVGAEASASAAGSMRGTRIVLGADCLPSIVVFGTGVAEPFLG